MISSRMVPIKVIYVYRTDPFKDEYGGGNAYMRFLTRQAIKKGIRVKFVGVKLCEHKNKNPDLRFIPLLKNTDKWWIYLLVSFFRVPFLKIESDEIIHTGRLIFLLPYVVFHPKNPKVLKSDQPMVAALMGYPKILLKILVPLFNAVERFILGRIDAVVAAEHVVDLYFMKKYPQLRSLFKRDILPATGVNTNVFKCLDKASARNSVQISADAKVVLFVGRLSRIKGVDFLIDAFGEVVALEPNALFIIVGGGEYEEGLKIYREQKPFKDKVKFMGVKVGKELVDIYNSADVLVLGSVAEGNPGVLREALTCGIPVVSMDVGDARQILTDPRLGSVVAEKDPKVFAKAISKVLSQDPKQVCQACVDRAVEFSEENVFASVFGMYEEIMASKKEDG